MTTILSRLEFKYVPPEDESVDGEYEVKLDGDATAYAIQDASGDFLVNEYGYEEPGNEGSFYVQTHGEHRSLKTAKEHVATIIEASLDAAPSPSTGI